MSKHLLREVAALIASGLLAGCPGTSERATRENRPPHHPSTVREVVEADASVDSRRALAAWAEDATLSGPLRLTALRRLSELAPGEAVPVAARLVGDSDELLRINALALLARTSDARAREVVAGLVPADQAMVAKLRR